MSRIKKSRKPSFVPTSAAKDDKKKEIVVADKKPKKKTGKQSGNRQKEAIQVKQSSNGNKQAKDPRIGSKKPIDLGKPAVAAAAEKAKKIKKTPIAAIREVTSASNINDDEALKQELYAIEDDTQLQVILAKQEDEIDLTEEEVDFFNEKMARHEELRQALGWDDDEDEDIIVTKASGTIDEEALWDKLDKPDLSDFE